MNLTLFFDENEFLLAIVKFIGMFRDLNVGLKFFALESFGK